MYYVQRKVIFYMQISAVPTVFQYVIPSFDFQGKAIPDHLQSRAEGYRKDIYHVEKIYIFTFLFGMRHLLSIPVKTIDLVYMLVIDSHHSENAIELQAW